MVHIVVIVFNLLTAVQVCSFDSWLRTSVDWCYDGINGQYFELAHALHCMK